MPTVLQNLSPCCQKTNMFKSSRPVPFVWEPQKAAEYILKKVFKGKETISFPIFWQLFFYILRIFPTKMASRIFSS